MLLTAFVGQATGQIDAANGIISISANEINDHLH